MKPDLEALRRDERIAETLDRVTERLTDAIKQLHAEQAELRDEVHALSNRIESVARSVKP